MTLGIETKLLIGGLVGTVAGLSGKKLKAISYVGSILTGLGSAIYLTPLTAELLNVTNEQSRIGIAVLIGYLGITGMQKILLKKLEEWKQ